MCLLVWLLRKGQLLVKLGPYHAEPHEAEATPKANNVRTRDGVNPPYPYQPKLQTVSNMKHDDLEIMGFLTADPTTTGG